MIHFKQIAVDGLWKNNPALVQILGMCPLMAVSSSVVNAIGLGLATALTLTITNGLVSALRNVVAPEVRIPIYVLVIACVVTAIQQAMNAYFPELYKILGIFIPLITTNCIVIARAESFAAKNSVPAALFDGFMMGLGFMAILIVLGAMRELVGHGTLFAQAHLMFGEMGRWLTIQVFDHYRGFLLAILPPGAFLGLGFIIAIKNVIDARGKRKAAASPALTVATDQSPARA